MNAVSIRSSRAGFRRRRFVSTGVVVLAVAALLSSAGCDNTTQTTSGRRYLDQYGQPGRMGGSNGGNNDGGGSSVGASEIDRRIAEVAAVEPQLRFPARIGLARIEKGQLTDIPLDEGDVWLNLREQLGVSYGEFVPVSPLIAALVSETGVPAARRSLRPATLQEAVAHIRLGAARQHLDAVLIYEVAVNSETKSTGFTILDWTLIGAYARTRQTKAEAYATALLIDVRNGYPYGTALGAAHDERATALAGSGAQRERQRATVAVRAVRDLAPDIGAMFRKLALELPAATAAATGAGAGS